jgi:predicted RNase H-like HicB family nuclease
MSETEITFIFQESPEGGYDARAIGHSIFTQANTMVELEANVKDAVACHFGEKIPLPKEIEDLFWE